MEHNTSPLLLEDVLITVFRHVITIAPSAVGSILLVNKKWNKCVRHPRVWHPHPLSIPTLTSINEVIDYQQLYYYISPLLESEIDAQISYLLKYRQDLRTNRKKRKLYHIPADQQQWRAELIHELNTNVTITTPQGDRRQFIQSYMDVNLGDYQQYCRNNFITAKQFAVMLAITTFTPNMRPSWVMDAWPGIKHLFKSRDQLSQEACITPGPISLQSPSGLIKDHRLYVPFIIHSLPLLKGETNKRLVGNSFVLSCSETSSQTKWVANYHLMQYYAWLSFLTPDRWLAMFYIYNSHEYDSYGRLICVKGDNSTGKSEVFEIKEQFDLTPYTSEKGDAAIKALYEISDKAWEEIDEIPDVKDNNTLLQVLTGISWDFLDMI